MHSDETLEDDGPCGIAEAVCEGAKDFADASFAGMGSDEDVLNILCLWRGILRRGACVSIPIPGTDPQNKTRGARLESQIYRIPCWPPHASSVIHRQRTLILVAPLTDFSKELDIVLATGNSVELWDRER